MKPLGWLLAYFCVVFIGAALLAPWVYHGAHRLSHFIPALTPLVENPFHRYLNRLLIMIGLLGLWPLLQGIKLANLQVLGLRPVNPAWQCTRTGFALGFISLAIAAAAAIAAGARTLEPAAASQFAGHLINAALAALLVSVLEEVLFRGALFGALCQSMNWKWALLVSSCAYSILHFFERPSEPGAINWMTGFRVLGEMLSGFARVEQLIPGFLNLTLAGLILGLAYRRSGSLYFSIGLHAGWIFWLKWYGLATDSAPHANIEMWGSRKLIDGWFAFFILSCVFSWIVWRWRHHQRETDLCTD